MSNEQTKSLQRCAIYTRKSTNHLLERDVNSLDIQREICGAYIKSQQYRGWLELPKRYDDANQSGSGLERPALIELMKDIEAGEVDAVVVYKIDRLTRSLFDFVRLVEIFNQHGTTLNSITQAFDTSDSMGRMILNILLTFSQFERELIAERVRDSIRMRKRLGKVHGGLPPFGYVMTQNILRVDEHEAEIVRFIFREFIRTRCYSSVMRTVRDAGLSSSVKYSKHGNVRGGRPISPGSVYSILCNPVYVGEIRGHDGTYPGQHEPIISRETWEAAKLITAERRKKEPLSKHTNHFLAGLLEDDLGRNMLLTIDSKRGRDFYYASRNAAWSQSEYRRAYRSHASRLEGLILASVSEFLCDRGKLRQALKTLGLHGEELTKLAVRGKTAAAHLNASPIEWMNDLFVALAVRIEIGQEHVQIVFRSIELQRLLLWNGKNRFRGQPSDWPCSDARYALDVAVKAISGERMPLVHITPRSAGNEAVADRKLVALVESARTAQRMVEENREQSMEQLAKKLDCRPVHFSRLVRLNYLAPDIITAILDGTQPPTLTRDSLLMAPLPTDWALQRKLLGFPTFERPPVAWQLARRRSWER